MLVIAAGTLVAIAAVLSVLWWLLVGVPQTMLTSTLGYACVPGLGIDCARAIADSRQAVPLTLGGLLGVVGVVFTYLRWRAERDSTDETIEEGKRAAERLKREGDQLEVTRITDALGLLESDDAAKRTAAISLLIDYAVTTDQHRYTRLILDVLVSFLAREEQHGYDLSGDGVTDERLPLSPAGRQAILGILNVAVERRAEVTLAGLTFVDLEAPHSHWNYIRLQNLAFHRCDFTGADFSPHTEDGTDEFTPHHERVRFQDCTMTFAAFSNVRQSRCTYAYTAGASTGGRFDDVSFSGARLFNVDFNGVQMYGETFRDASLHQVRFDGKSFVYANAIVGAELTVVEFSPDMYDEPPILITTRGNWKMRSIVPCGRVLSVASEDVPLGYPAAEPGGDVASSAPARDSGQAPGDSRTPEPGPTSESPT